MFIVYLYTKRSNCNTHSRSQATHLYTSKGAIIFVCICVCFHRFFLFSNVVYSLCSLRYIVRPDGFRNSLDNIRSFCLSLCVCMLLGRVHVMFSIHLQWKTITATHKFGICTKYTKKFSC